MLPSPKKLVRRVDNPWIRKFAQQGHNPSESRWELVSIMRQMDSHSPRRTTSHVPPPRKVRR